MELSSKEIEVVLRLINYYLVFNHHASEEEMNDVYRLNERMWRVTKDEFIKIREMEKYGRSSERELK